MNSRKITVAIPVYNSARCLQATLESLMHQTMDANEFEVICVNDCSTDNSKEVIETYGQKMPNLVLINLEQNTGGAMVPRNLAIDKASGTYIHFLDSDDFLGEEALERLYNAAETYGSDVVFGNHVGVNGRGVFRHMFKNGNLPQANLLTDHLVYALAPHKMFRTSFLNHYQIRFDPQAKGGNDDQLFVFTCYLKAKVITLLSDYDYYFIVARGNENFTSKVYPAQIYFHAPFKIMSVVEEHFADASLRARYKAVYLNRFLATERLRKFLLDPDFPEEKKKEYLLEGKRFLVQHIDDLTMQAIHAKNADFLKAVIAEDRERIRQLTIQRQQAFKKSKNASVNLAVPKYAILNAYSRPSIHASTASNTCNGINRPFQVFFSIKEWCEVRLQEDNGEGTYAVFVQRKDVRYTLSYLMHTSIERLIKLTQKKGITKPVLLNTLRTSG